MCILISGMISVIKNAEVNVYVYVIHFQNKFLITLRHHFFFDFSQVFIARTTKKLGNMYLQTCQ